MSDMKAPSEDSRDALRKPLSERLAAVFAVTGSAGVVVSFVYDWGFFFALGIPFSEAPTALSDHMRGWLIWLPIVIGPVLFFLAQELLVSRLERGLSEEEIIVSSSNPARTRRLRNRPRKVIAATAVVVLFLWVLFGGSFAFARPFAFFIVWVLFVQWVFRDCRLDADWPACVKNGITWVPAVLLVVFFLGGNQAQLGMLKPAPSHRIEWSAPVGDAPAVEVRLLRSFQDWLLVRDGDRNVAWIRSIDVVRMERLEASAPFQGLLCVLSSDWCLPHVRREALESPASGDAAATSPLLSLSPYEGIEGVGEGLAQ